MPCGGGDIGLNVWVENDELLVYIARAGCRDENGALLKLGRCRINLTPNPFANAEFRQELKLRQGYVLVSAKQPDGKSVEIKVWVEVSQPIVHLDIVSDDPITAEATYESWRSETTELTSDKSKHGRRGMCMVNYDGYPGKVFLYKDKIRPAKDLVRFHHRVSNEKDCFNFQVKQQGFEAFRDQMVNPLENLVWGGALAGDSFVFKGEHDGTYAECKFHAWQYVSEKPAATQRIRVCLHKDTSTDQEDWDAALQKLIDLTPTEDRTAWEQNLKWWDAFWDKSYLVINSGGKEDDIAWRIGRNYQLFRYMLACNMNGSEPTLFNGGLFTFDPMYVEERDTPDESFRLGGGHCDSVGERDQKNFTPDHRQWGGAFTGQNQRLVYRPMLKTGDFNMLPSGFSLYLNALPNGQAWVKRFWGHDGCCFEEQICITGILGSAMYGHSENDKVEHDGRVDRIRAQDTDPGNPCSLGIAKLYESALDWCWLILQYHKFSGNDISKYMSLIEQSVIFYDEHYRYQCKELTGKELDDNGKLAIFPANSLEDHWGGRNPTSTIAGLTRLLAELIELPCTSADNKIRWQNMLKTLPKMPTANNEEFGGEYLKPTENHEHCSWHCPEMFPLYPYELFGIGLDNLDLMKHTSLATGVDRFKARTWEQANIHAARLGDGELARELNCKKMDDGPYRFPAFWPADVDWAPDHNWGGSGMIGMQEMLMQTHSSLDELQHGKPGAIRLLPAWPKEWDVDFKMHAPHRTTVEAKIRSGKITDLKVTPQSRRNDVEIMEN